jgi:Protein of unknown function (DUF3313)
MLRSIFTRSQWAAVIILLAVVALGQLGCGPVRARRRPAEPTGFLGDYSQLEKVEGYDFLQMYIAPADWSKYHAIHLDSVTLWKASPGPAKLTDADQLLLTDILYKALYDALTERFLMAEHPGPNTIEGRDGITERLLVAAVDSRAG